MNILSRLKKPLYFALIASLLLQNSLFLEAFKPQKAKAVEPLPISQIVYITDPQTIDKNEVSQKIKVQTQDENGSPVNVTEKTTFNVTSSSTTGQFSRNGIDNWVSSDFTFNIAEENKQNGFYYRDSIYGVYDFSVVSTEHPEWGNIIQPITITNTDSQSPTSKIYFPEGKSYQNKVNYIEGEAFDNVDIQKVEVKIYDETDETYYDGNNWTSTQTWHNALLTEFLSQTIEENYSTGFQLDVINSAFSNNHTYYIYSRATDSNGNIENSDSEIKSSFTFDNQAPTGSILINDGADATNGDDAYVCADKETYPQVKLSFGYQDNFKPGQGDFVENGAQVIFIGDSVAQMIVSNNPNLDKDGQLQPDGINDLSGQWIPLQREYFPWNLSKGDGLKHVYVQFKDQAGNISQVYTDEIFYSLKNNGENKIALDAGINDISPFENVSMLINAKEQTDFFFSSYESNPMGSDSGIKFLNHFYDFNPVDDAKIEFPVLIFIYFTQADLDNAGMTIDQIQGIHYWDFSSNSWKLYTDTGVVPFDYEGYAGFVYAMVDHFTPMSIGGDITAPSKILNLVGTPGDTKVALNWDKLADAAKYEVRYRQATSIDSDPYTTMLLDNNNTEITGLTNGVQYEFGVRAIDSAGNKGEWAVVVATPKGSDSSSSGDSKYTGWYGYFGAGTAYAADPSETSTNKKDTKKDTEIIEDDEKVKGEETTEGETEGARTAVTIGIIIIAIGAALGGYYGYQWWIAGNHEEEEKDEKPKTTDNKPKPKKTNRRW